MNCAKFVHIHIKKLKEGGTAYFALIKLNQF